MTFDTVGTFENIGTFGNFGSVGTFTVVWSGLVQLGTVWLGFGFTWNS